MKTIKILLLLGLLGIISASAFIYSGIYPIGADVPHNKSGDSRFGTLMFLAARSMEFSRTCSNIQ